jgi:hypothetical protein
MVLCGRACTECRGSLRQVAKHCDAGWLPLLSLESQVKEGVQGLIPLVVVNNVRGEGIEPPPYCSALAAVARLFH